MKVDLVRLVIAAVVAGSTTSLMAQPAPAAVAPGFPVKAIRIVVGFPAGGGTDFHARALTQKLSERLGQPVVVDNRPGASTLIGGEIVVRSAPDGHTLFLATFTNAINPSLQSRMSWDILKDLTPVSMLATSANLLVVHPSLPVRSVRDLISLAKAKSGQLNFASGGNGTPGHLAGELLKMRTGIAMTHIAYKGNAPTVAAVIGGEVPIMFGNTIVTTAQVESKRLRALAVTSAQRLAQFPALPTMAESGVPDFEFVAWFGLMAPAQTPRQIIMRLNADIIEILRTNEVRGLLSREGSDAAGSTPEQLDAFLRAEIAKWAVVVKSLALRPE